MISMHPALKVTNLKKTYPTGTAALKDVSLEVPAGDFFALLGPNGAGKTTLIGIATGLVNKTEGKVEVFGVDFDKDPDLAKSYIGLVPQEFNFNIFEKTIDVVTTQAGFYGIPYLQAKENAEQILKDLGLWEKRNDKSMTLSGGMKRRLMIARALVHKPKLLILDEPTAGVDIELRRGMWDYLRTLIGSGVTIILTTHYLEEAEQLAKNLAIINRGEIVESGTMKGVLSKLSAETILVDTDRDISAEDLSKLELFHPVRVDENTLELMVSREHSISDAILALRELGLKVMSMRNKTNRLENHFINLTESTV